MEGFVSCLPHSTQLQGVCDQHQILLPQGGRAKGTHHHAKLLLAAVSIYEDRLLPYLHGSRFPGTPRGLPDLSGLG